MMDRYCLVDNEFGKRLTYFLTTKMLVIIHAVDKSVKISEKKLMIYQAAYFNYYYLQCIVLIVFIKCIGKVQFMCALTSAMHIFRKMCDFD